MADANSIYFKVNLSLIYVSTPIGVQEKESIMSIRHDLKTAPRVTVWHHSAEPRDVKLQPSGQIF